MPRRPLTDFLTEAPGWMLLALLVYAPWAYGCTRVWTVNLLNKAMLVTIGFWLISCVVRRARPVIPPLFLGLGGFLLLQGWWMILNAHYRYDRYDLKFIPVACLWPFAPGVLDKVDAVPIMLRLTGFLGILGLVSDFSQRPQWRTRIWWTCGLVGASIILFGLVERITDAQMIFWEQRSVTHLFFATYYYHANAGAFVNLVLPLIFGLVLASSKRRDDHLGRALWVPALLIALAGAIAAASKGALLVTLLSIVALSVWRARNLGKWWGGLTTGLRVATSIGVVVAIAGICGIGWESMQDRWLNEDWTSNSSAVRLMAYQACLDMLPDTSWWGFGAGNFMIAFPHYTNRFGDSLEGIWRFAHNDYLQTAIEWGWVGAAGWAILYFGGIARGLRAYARRENDLSSTDRILVFTASVALLGVSVHSMFDFPLQIASLQLYAAVYLGLLGGSPTWGLWNPPAEAQPQPRRLAKVSPRVAATNYP